MQRDLMPAREGDECARPPKGGLLLLLAFRLLLARHLGAFASRLSQPDGDRLLAALHLLAGSSAFERAAFPLAHGALHLLARLLAILSGHRSLLFRCSVAGTAPRRSTNDAEL